MVSSDNQESTIGPEFVAELTDISLTLAGIDQRKKEAETDYQAARRALFALLDRETGVGSRITIPIPETGRRIGRTIAYGSPSLDAEALRVAIGDEKFEKVTTKTVTYALDFKALHQALLDEEITKSQIENAIIPGSVTQRLLHSKIGSKDDTEEPRPKTEVEGLLEF
jgi:hypothetical protein